MMRVMLAFLRVETALCELLNWPFVLVLAEVALTVGTARCGVG